MMYYYYIMNKEKYAVRTQISLSPELKNLIEKESGLLNEGLSEYLRKSAILRMALKIRQENELAVVAEAVVGKVKKNKGGWKDVKDVKEWQRSQRRHEDTHRS